MQIIIGAQLNGSGCIYRDNGGGAGLENWATIRAAASGVVNPTTSELHVYGTTGDLWQQLGRAIFQFPLTDSRLVGATITGITMKFACTGQTSDHTRGLILRIVSSSPASNTVLATTDFAQVGSIAMSDTDIAIGSFIGYLEGDNDFVLNAAGIALAQSKIGTFLSLGGKWTHDINNSVPSNDPGYVSSVSWNEGVNQLRIVVDYEPAKSPLPAHRHV